MERGVGEWGNECSVKEGYGETLLSKVSLKILTEGVMKTETVSLFQCFRAPIEGRVEWEGEKATLVPHPKDL